MSDWRGLGRILAVRLDSMGDVLMTTPALRALREGCGHLTLLASPAGVAIARLVAEVDDVISYQPPWMKAGEAQPVSYDTAMIERLAAGGYDAAVIFTVYSQTPFPAAMLARLAGIPRTLAWCRERAYRLVSDELAETEPEGGIRHEVQRHLDLVAARGFIPSATGLSLTPGEAAEREADRLLALHGLGGDWAVVHAGASAPSRRWPLASFVETIARLSGDHGWRIVLTGDESEAAANVRLAAAAPGRVVDLSGALDLAVFAALIGRAPLLISNNSGPAHVAAAMGTPVVDLYALTNPQHTPWQVPARVLSHDVPCRWCYKSVCPEGHHRCLAGVTPAEVVAAARDLTRLRAAA